MWIFYWEGLLCLVTPAHFQTHISIFFDTWKFETFVPHCHSAGKHDNTDCSALTLKAFALIPYFAANHSWWSSKLFCSHLFYLWLSAFKVLVAPGNHASVLLTISVSWTPPLNSTTAFFLFFLFFFKAMVRQNVFYHHLLHSAVHSVIFILKL